MKKSAFLILFLTLTICLQAQILDPVKWKTSVVKINDTDYDLIATATIQSGWHLYSQTVPADGPIPTVFTFEGNSSYQKRGNTKEGVGHEVDDKIFNMRIKYFDKVAEFKQRIRLLGKKPLQINGIVEYMVCDDSSCLPPKEVDLLFVIK
jgi:thiol:disulfide interchange protein DsbD